MVPPTTCGWMSGNSLQIMCLLDRQARFMDCVIDCTCATFDVVPSLLRADVDAYLPWCSIFRTRGVRGRKLRV